MENKKLIRLPYTLISNIITYCFNEEDMIFKVRLISRETLTECDKAEV